MNSVSEALVYGVPMVVIPFSSDQPVNAHCVEKLGVGKKLENAEVSADKLREAVRSVKSIICGLPCPVSGNGFATQSKVEMAYFSGLNHWFVLFLGQISYDEVTKGGARWIRSK